MKKIDLHTDKIGTGFKTPPDYFKNLSASVFSRLEEQPETKVVVLRERPTSWIYAAAAILILALLLPFLNTLVNSDSPVANNQAVEDYLVVHRQISSEELISYMDSDELPSLKYENQLDEQLLEDELVKNKNLEFLMH